MRHLTRPLAALILGLAAAPAYARMEPTPPPSGIVVHLFGPNSLCSHILPTGPEPSPAQPGSAAATGSGGQASTAASDTQPSPSWGDIAHQMFVTGDPSQEGPAALSKGKTRP